MTPPECMSEHLRPAANRSRVRLCPVRAMASPRKRPMTRPQLWALSDGAIHVNLRLCGTFNPPVGIGALTREEELRLIEGFRAGDAGAFDALVEDFRAKAYSLAYRWTQNREDALDVCQDAFLRLYRALPNWSARASVFTWLYRVIINRAIDMKRKRVRRKTVSADAGWKAGAGQKPGDEERVLPEAQASGLANPERLVSSKELAGRIREAVMRLPPKQQQVFVLRHFEDLPLKEIAAIQQTSLGAVKATLFQAVRKLRDMLADYWTARPTEE
jgi:RNA polymerase sigma-70 factor (ECF subfamily)